jgi:peptidoglycan/LPS O-acetylase OafA/YrhL
VRLAGELFGPGAPLIAVVAVFATGCSAAVACAWFAWKYLERPSMALSKRMRLGSDRAEARAHEALGDAVPMTAS